MPSGAAAIAATPDCPFRNSARGNPGDRLCSRSCSALISASFHAGNWRVRKRRNRSRNTSRPPRRPASCASGRARSRRNMRPSWRAKRSTTSSRRPRRSSAIPITRRVRFFVSLQACIVSRSVRPRSQSALVKRQQLFSGFQKVRTAGGLEKTLNGRMHTGEVALGGRGGGGFHSVCYHSTSPMETVLGWVTHYGSVSLFFLMMLGIVGLPVPDETLLVFSGYLIFKGKLNPVFTFCVALAGSATGITLSYCAGTDLRIEAHPQVWPLRSSRRGALLRRSTNGSNASGDGVCFSATTSPVCGTSRRWSPAHRIWNIRFSPRLPTAVRSRGC